MTKLPNIEIIVGDKTLEEIFAEYAKRLMLASPEVIDELYRKFVPHHIVERCTSKSMSIGDLNKILEATIGVRLCVVSINDLRANFESPQVGKSVTIKAEKVD